VSKKGHKGVFSGKRFLKKIVQKSYEMLRLQLKKQLKKIWQEGTFILFF
jgi:poly-beta-hydroxyalkanoate depolymerase